MDDKQPEDACKLEKSAKSSTSSDSSEYELVENNNQNLSIPIIENNNVSVELINDAIGSSSTVNSPTAENMIVGKSIFYDRTNSESDDEGFIEKKVLCYQNYLNFFCRRNLRNW